jgi:crotonobetainyl-CoA:carnitine CoA-transferase CaiB-like acyl-CoA transferase
VYVHAAGYGTSGPFANRPIYAHVAGAVAGGIARYSGEWLDPELTKELTRIEAQAIVAPRLRGPIDGDSNATLTVFTALMLALYDQRCTGQGQFVATSLINGNAMAYSDDFNRYEGNPPLPAPDEDKRGLHALYRSYKTGDGWVFLAAPTCRDWEALVSGLGRSDLATDPRFATAAVRAENDAALIGKLDRTFGTKSALEWEKALSSKGVACVPTSTRFVSVSQFSRKKSPASPGPHQPTFLIQLSAMIENPS